MSSTRSSGPPSQRLNRRRHTEAQAEVAQIQQAEAIEKADRQDRLRRALATQRARFGAQGTGSGDSSAAALGGLADADREAREAAELTDIRLQRVNDQLATVKRKSLLDTKYPRYQKAISAVRQGVSGLSLLDD